jgi:hypothetical protein
VIRISEEQPLSVKECLRLERLPHAEKINHWNAERPWRGLKLPRKIEPIPPGHIFSDGAGNITKMPPLVGRPCFANVTAYLRHGGGQQFWNPRTKRWMNSRCMRCKVVTACEGIAEERLRATPEIAHAYLEWLRAGGRRATFKPKSASSLAKAYYRKLLHLLRTEVQFTSENDRVAIAHYEAVLEKRREKDRQRQRDRRLRASLERARAGQFDKHTETILNSQRIWRQIRHAEAREHPRGPRQLIAAGPDSSAFDAQVWLVKTRFELRGKSVNASNTAKGMQSLGFELHRSHNALRDRVRRSLTRVALLERFQLPGRTEPVWPKFGQRELREALDFDPLGLAA